MQINTSMAAMERSRVWKLIVALGGAAVIASVGMSGCRDQPLPTEPSAVTAPEPSLSRYPTEEEYAEMPAEFRQAPGIIRTWLDVGFVSGHAYGQAGMEYLANYAKIMVPLTLLFDNREVTRTTGLAEKASFLPAVRELVAVASLGVTKSCGHTANARGEYYIRNQFPLKTGWFEWGHESDSQDGSKSQPSCSCATTSLDEAAYDPYAPDDGNAGCDSGSSGGDGSGTQFYPGDNTGGETVDWNTGIGNGGSSACGASAVVEYVCFDTWNEETQSWEEWGCGHVTMC